MTIRSFSYGGGVQSTAALVLAAQGRIDYPLFIMSNVGDDSEHPDTLEYVEKYAKPYAADHGIELVVVQKRRRDGTPITLLQKATEFIDCPDCRGSGELPTDPDVLTIGPAWPLAVAEGLYEGQTAPCTRCSGSGSARRMSVPIPARMSNGAPTSRSCTVDFKVLTIAKELKRRGARAPKPCQKHACVDEPCGPALARERAACSECDPGAVAVVGIGISLDEISRANSRNSIAHERIVYPLIGIGDDTGLKLRRDDCSRIIRDAGLPVPPKSSCYFCPFHRPEAWQDLARERPDLFEKSAQLEDTLNATRAHAGKDPMYLTRFGVPLREAIDTDQPLLPLLDDADGSCDSGWCFT